MDTTFGIIFSLSLSTLAKKKIQKEAQWILIGKLLVINIYIM